MLAALRGGAKEKSALEKALGEGGAVEAGSTACADAPAASSSGASPPAPEAKPKTRDLKSMLSGGSAFGAMNAFVKAGKAYRWRKHMVVTQMLDEWWAVMTGHLEESGKMDEGLEWDDYLGIFKKVYKALVSSYDEEEAHEAVKEDWENDAKGGDRLPASRVRDAVFELADVWTSGSTPEECATFLGDLLNQLCSVGADGKRRFLGIDDVAAGAGAALDSAGDGPGEDDDEPPPALPPIRRV